MQFLIAVAVAAMFGLAAFIFTFIITGTIYWRRRSWQQVFTDLIANPITPDLETPPWLTSSTGTAGSSWERPLSFPLWRS